MIAKKPELLVQEFDKVSVRDYLAKLDEIVLENGGNQPIIIHIDSYGGSVDGLALLYNKIKSLTNPIYTFTSSKAMSCGAILLSAAAPKGHRYAAEHSRILIHEVSSGAVGALPELVDTLKEVTELNNVWIGILAKSMGLKDADKIRKLIKARNNHTDYCMSAKEALKLKMIDHIGYLSLEHSEQYHLVAKVDRKPKGK